MHRIIPVLLCLLLGTQAFAQPKGYQPLKDQEGFRRALTGAHAARQTIASDFTQVKHLSLLEDKIRSKGQFFFRKEDKVRIEYTTPYEYLLVMNGGQILIRDGQKTSRVNTRGSSMLQSVNRIMVDCMRGTVFQNPDFTVTAYENAGSYLLELTPAKEAMKKMFRRIDVQMDRKNLDVMKLTMTEAGGDLTEMIFTNTRHNTALNEALFQVK